MAVDLFVNPASATGGVAARIAEVLVTFRKLGHPIELHNPPSAAAAQAQMRTVAESGAERLIVIGGDGMVHLAANALAHSETALGIISAGTGNDAATVLGIPDDLDQACRVAMGAAAPIDLIESSSGDVAVTSATLGFSVAVNERADSMRFPRGGARYTVSSLVELPRLDIHELTMTLDGEVHEVSANLVAIANMANFGGGMKIAPDADPRDGLLDVVVIGPAGRAIFTALLPTVFSGRHVKSKHVTVHRAATVELTGAALHLRADGEPFGELPQTLTARPNALLVAV